MLTEFLDRLIPLIPNYPVLVFCILLMSASGYLICLSLNESSPKSINSIVFGFGFSMVILLITNIDTFFINRDKMDVRYFVDRLLFSSILSICISFLVCIATSIYYSRKIVERSNECNEKNAEVTGHIKRPKK